MRCVYIRIRDKNKRKYKKIGYVEGNEIKIDWSIVPVIKNQLRALYIRVLEKYKRKWLNIGFICPETRHVSINWVEIPKSGRKIRVVKEVASGTPRYYKFYIENDGLFVQVGSAKMEPEIKTVAKNLPSVKEVRPLEGNPSVEYMSSGFLSLIMGMSKKELKMLFKLLTHMRTSKQFKIFREMELNLDNMKKAFEEFKEEYRVIGFDDRDRQGYIKCSYGYLFYSYGGWRKGDRAWFLAHLSSPDVLYLVTENGEIYRTSNQGSFDYSALQAIYDLNYEKKIPDSMGKTDYLPSNFVKTLEKTNPALAITLGLTMESKETSFSDPQPDPLKGISKALGPP